MVPDLEHFFTNSFPCLDVQFSGSEGSLETLKISHYFPSLFSTSECLGQGGLQPQPQARPEPDHLPWLSETGAAQWKYKVSHISGHVSKLKLPIKVILKRVKRKR